MPTRSDCRELLRDRQKAPHRANFPSSLAWVFGSGIIRPETNAPHWAQRAGFGQPFVASAQKLMFHGGILREFGVVARKHGILLLSVPNSGVKVAHASTDAFVCAWIGRRHDELHCAMVFKSLAFSAIINCSAQEYDTPSTTNDEGDHCEEQDGGCQNNTTQTANYLTAKNTVR